MDLTAAEGVAATIAAHSEAELRAARQLLSGELARRLRPAIDLIAETLALIEVGIDFVEEDISFLSPVEMKERINRADGILTHIIEQSARFETLTHEPTAVLVGLPNAGKSTLLNALAGSERAVVSPVAGTTRDALSVEVALPRGVIRVIDVAGISSSPHASASDPSSPGDIERQMRERALREIQTADLVLLVHDGSSPHSPVSPPRPPDLIVLTKCDLLSSPKNIPSEIGPRTIALSAQTGEKLDVLREALDAMAFGSRALGATLALNARHLHAIADARAALTRAAGLIAQGGELIALELREALDALGSILGAVSPDDLLGRIFSAFCIGK
jgi:tRNA modification GTPase